MMGDKKLGWRGGKGRVLTFIKCLLDARTPTVTRAVSSPGKLLPWGTQGSAPPKLLVMSSHSPLSLPEVYI